MKKDSVRFNIPDVGTAELEYVRQALESGSLSGDGPFTHKCHAILEGIYSGTVLLMHSCTAALEAAAILCDLQPGDEVIIPSFTFVSTANAVVLRGATPVFVDIDEKTLNMDPAALEKAITNKSRAIIPVHYAGVAAPMNKISEIALAKNLIVIEDAAQGYGASYEDRPLGSLGSLGCISFHETKNIVSGEGGALVVNDKRLAARAQHIREKGTNRTEFMRKEVTKYEWIDVGSSFLPSDILAAVLLAQLERADEIGTRRMAIWKRYQEAFSILHTTGFRFPAPPQNVQHNGHVYFIIAPDTAAQQIILKNLKADGIAASSHYVPLHSSPAGLRYGRPHGLMEITNHIASCMVRLPMHSTLAVEEVEYVIERTIFHISNF